MLSVNGQAWTQIDQAQAGYGRPVKGIQAERQATRLFEHAHRSARKNRIMSWLRRQEDRLWHLHPRSPIREVSNRSQQIVPVDRIKGSAGGRSNDYDANFRPLHRHTKERWVSVASAVQQGKRLPPAELVKIDDVYFVVDGHHRISVARANGQTEIRANVTVCEYLTPSGCAR